MFCRVLDNIFILSLAFCSCNNKHPDFPSSVDLREHVSFPVKLDSFIFTRLSSQSAISMNTSKQYMEYSYYIGGEVKFRYDYQLGSFYGSPFIRTFDYVENGTFTLISEVAVPPGFSTYYFINAKRFYPDENNIINYKFKSGTHNGRFKMTCMFVSKDGKQQRKDYVKHVDLIDSTLLVKKSLVEHGLWDDRIP